MAATKEDAALVEVESEDGGAVVWLRGDWGTAPNLPTSAAVDARVGAASAVIDGAGLATSHPRVAAFVRELTRRLRARGIDVGHRGMSDNVAALLALAGTAPAAPADAARPGAAERLGDYTRTRAQALSAVAAFVGYAAAATPGFAAGRSQTRWRDFVDLVRETGAASLPVITIVNLLVGMVLGFVGAIQLVTFGAGMYLADLVGIATAREMAAIMTAFVLAGRIGATFAAHLATMQANEEIDALRTTGVSPFDFLVMPRLAALSLMMPLLYLYAAAVGIVGGLLVAMLVIGTPPAAFVERLHNAIAVRHFVIGFGKSIGFGALIALASCYIGLGAGRNAAAVGRAATRTVVACIIGIIVIDAVFALCTNALGV